MRKRRLLLVAVASLVAVVIIWPREREPEYQGKRLSEWLATCRPFYREIGNNLPEGMIQQAHGAVRKIGTNALPWLLKWISYKQPRWQSKLCMTFRKLPSGLRLNAVERLLAPPQPDPHELALRGFALLGNRARPAVPKLISLTQEGSNRTAFFALGLVGKPAEAAMPGLSNVLNVLDPAVYFNPELRRVMKEK